MSGSTRAINDVMANAVSLTGGLKQPQSGTPGRPFPVAKFTPRGPGYANPGGGGVAGTGVEQSLKGAEKQLQDQTNLQNNQTVKPNKPLTGNFQPSWLRNQPPTKGILQPGPGPIARIGQPYEVNPAFPNPIMGGPTSPVPGPVVPNNPLNQLPVDMNGNPLTGNDIPFGAKVMPGGGQGYDPITGEYYT